MISLHDLSVELAFADNITPIEARRIVYTYLGQVQEADGREYDLQGLPDDVADAIRHAYSIGMEWDSILGEVTA